MSIESELDQLYLELEELEYKINILLDDMTKAKQDEDIQD